MKRHLFSLTLLSIILISFAPSVPAQQCGVHCGTERWALKSLSDVDVDEVDFEPVTKTIHWIRTRERPAKLRGLLSGVRDQFPFLRDGDTSESIYMTDSVEMVLTCPDCRMSLAYRAEEITRHKAQ